MALFNENISNWSNWGKVFQSIPSFHNLAEYIFQKENLPFSNLTHLTPGSNAVFRVDDYVIKIYAPKESDIDSASDFETELYATEFALNANVLVPKIIASGTVDDRYSFNYIIMEYIESTPFSEAMKSMSEAEKVEFARKLRIVTDRLNVKAGEYNGIEVFSAAEHNNRWNKFRDSFNRDRVSYIRSYGYDEKIFVHGDLCSDNILLNENGDICIIDFADSVLAPLQYEQGHIAVELFNLDRSFLQGYFGNISNEELTEICVSGLLLHDFGADIIFQHLVPPHSLNSVEDLKTVIQTRLLRDSLYIYSSRFVITEFDISMAEELQENSIDDDNRRFVPDEVFETVEDAKETIQWLMDCYQKEYEPLVYPIILHSGENVGYIQAVPKEEGLWEIGYHIGGRYTGNGYATEAVEVFLPVIMKRLAITTIIGIALKENAASIRVLEKTGFSLEYEGFANYQGNNREICRYIYSLNKKKHT